MRKEDRELFTELLVERAGEKKVGDILGGGGAVGAVGRGAGCFSEGSGGGAGVAGGARGAVPVLIGWGGIKRGAEAAAMPCGVTGTTKQDGVGFGPGVDRAAEAWFVVEALLLSSTAVAGGVGGKPVGAAAETGHGAAVCGGDGVVTKVGLRGE